MQKRLRIVNYAVNGIGTGHVTRLIAISRWLRRHAQRMNVSMEILFLTSSEASALLFAERFPTFKLPSRTTIAESEIDETQFVAMIGPWVRDTLNALSPDLLLVDTFPQGYFDELEPFLESGQAAALIYRPLKQVHASKKEFQEALKHYHLILIPEYQPSAEVLTPTSMQELVQHTGPLIVRERHEVLQRDEARRLLGIPGDRLTIYLTAGGGGDQNAERSLRLCYDALEPLDVHLVIGAGPLYRGRCFYGPRITWLAHLPAVEYVAGFDMAVSAVGYNSFNELMHFGVPAVFLPQAKWADDQHARAERAARVGAAVILDPNSADFGESLRQAIEDLRDSNRRLAASRAGRALVPQNHASEVAETLVNLLLAKDS